MPSRTPTRISLEPSPPRLLNRTSAWGYLFANLALPGLGTFVSGARISGLLQILLSQAGFAAALIWGIWAGGTWIRTGILPFQPCPLLWLGLVGTLVFLGTLAWSIVSSLCLLQRAGKNKL